MTTWTPIPLPASPSYAGAANGALLLESGYPDYLLQEDGFPPIKILFEGADNDLNWNNISTNTTVWTPITP